MEQRDGSFTIRTAVWLPSMSRALSGRGRNEIWRASRLLGRRHHNVLPRNDCWFLSDC
jgi:hypothetical protein